MPGKDQRAVHSFELVSGEVGVVPGDNQSKSEVHVMTGIFKGI